MHSLTTKIVVVAALYIASVQASMAAPAAGSSEITADRAWHLAAMYYARYVSGCGGVGQVVAHGDYWQAPVHFGYAGTFSGYIRVGRRTGAVEYSGHPTASARTLDIWFASVTKRHHAP